MQDAKNMKKKALYFIVLMGFVSLFSDITYEGARSLVGPYLGLLGASAVVVSAIAGLGELLGYTLRFVTGKLVDKTKKYWFFAILGYSMNLLVIPTLALTKHWILAAILVILERVGKALRKPAKDTITSFASSQVGYGTGFAIEEFMDQIGATIGPLFMSLTIANNIKLETVDAYRKAFAFLVFPAVITIGIIAIARVLVPNPEKMEKAKETIKDVKLDRTFYLYLAGISLIAFGFADFALIGFHAQRLNLLSPAIIPVAYMIAMIVDAFAALFFGKLFDKLGIGVLALSTFISAFYGIFSFGNSGTFIMVGSILWGIGMGAQESIMKAAVAKLVEKEKRATAYGFFNAVFGIAWFVGSALLGILYSISIRGLIIVSVISELTAVVIFIMIRKK
ncbi:MAG TPA: MFS transporter [Fervidobacterium nodosum]|nr:MFS transporter [Fervidobacterium nodosum]